MEPPGGGPFEAAITEWEDYSRRPR